MNMTKTDQLKALFTVTGNKSEKEIYTLWNQLKAIQVAVKNVNWSTVLVACEGKGFIIHQSFIKGQKELGSKLVELDDTRHTSKDLVKWFKQNGVEL